MSETAPRKAFGIKDLDQFRHTGKQIILQPEGLATGKIVAPYKKARA